MSTLRSARHAAADSDPLRPKPERSRHENRDARGIVPPAATASSSSTAGQPSRAARASPPRDGRELDPLRRDALSRRSLRRRVERRRRPPRHHEQQLRPRAVLSGAMLAAFAGSVQSSNHEQVAAPSRPGRQLSSGSAHRRRGWLCGCSIGKWQLAICSESGIMQQATPDFDVSNTRYETLRCQACTAVAEAETWLTLERNTGSWELG